MRKLALRISILVFGVLSIYYTYVINFPTYYNTATNTRWYFLKNILNKAEPYAQQPIIFLGDSRLNAGINFNEIDNCFNLSVGGASTIELYHILKKYLETYPTPKHVIISQSPRFFCEVFSYWKFAMRNHFFSKNDINDINYTYNLLQDSCLGENPNWKYLLYNIYYPAYYQPDIRTSRIFFSRKRNNRMIARMIKDKGKRPHHLPLKNSSELNYETHYLHFKPSELIEYYFDKLLLLCHQNNIHASFVLAPMNASSFNVLNTKFQEDFSKFLVLRSDKYPKFTIESKLYCYPDSCFGDPSHLNSNGQRLFTKYIKNKYTSISF